MRASFFSRKNGSACFYFNLTKGIVNAPLPMPIFFLFTNLFLQVHSIFPPVFKETKEKRNNIKVTVGTIVSLLSNWNQKIYSYLPAKESCTHEWMFANGEHYSYQREIYVQTELKFCFTLHSERKHVYLLRNLSPHQNSLFLIRLIELHIIQREMKVNFFLGDSNPTL
jgi:hypothetical protein